ncbi:MAG: PTS fructose transporter subunit IIB [Tissierellia bacterium]|nr:PTS fructose transporter subunit IIB [Tissierellia bacterium]
MAKKLVALCACPMGLAHTYMAAEAIEKAAKSLGYEVKVETQGAEGISNALTEQDLREADLIITSLSITPEGYERFDEYDIYEVRLQDAIKDAKQVITQVAQMEEEYRRNNGH